MQAVVIPPNVLADSSLNCADKMILGYIASHPDGVDDNGIQTIAAEVGISQKQFSGRLNRLLKIGKVVCTGDRATGRTIKLR